MPPPEFIAAPVAERPLVVAGMHRSGTSLVASVAAAAGVDMGERMLPPDPGNPLGYFEDLSFLTLHQRMFADAAPADDGGHPDWGWTESERLDRERFCLHLQEARALVEAHRGAGRPWGWKDPRTSLTLDFWDGFLPDARYLFVYRYPWDVADSMQRLGAEVFLRNPEYAHRIWAFYNRHVLDFFRRNRERSLLVSVNALMRHPERFRGLLAERLGLDLAEERLRQIVEAGQLRTVGGADPLIGLVAAASPESVRLLAELDSEAELSSAGLWRVPAASERRAVSPGTAPVRLSVVIPCFDHGELMIDAVASAERSIPEPYELIVVDDGSQQPRTLEVLAALEADGWFAVHQENRGLAAARNRGIELATGRYVIPLDSDNRLLPGFPEAAMRVLDGDERVGVVYGDLRELGLRSGTVQVPDFDLDTLLAGNFIDACAVIRKAAWSECGGFDGAMPHQGWEDWELWISAAGRGWKFHHLSGPCFEYRVRPGSMIWRLATPEVGRPLQAYIVEKHRELYLERLPWLLMKVQEGTRQAKRTEALQEELKELSGRLDGIESEREILEAERARLRAEKECLEKERDLLYRELGSWEERVGFMEGTAAWRLRERVLRLRGRRS